MQYFKKLLTQTFSFIIERTRTALTEQKPTSAQLYARASGYPSTESSFQKWKSGGGGGGWLLPLSLSAQHIEIPEKLCSSSCMHIFISIHTTQQRRWWRGRDRWIHCSPHHRAYAGVSVSAGRENGNVFRNALLLFINYTNFLEKFDENFFCNRSFALSILACWKVLNALFPIHLYIIFIYI